MADQAQSAPQAQMTTEALQDEQQQPQTQVQEQAPDRPEAPQPRANFDSLISAELMATIERTEQKQLIAIEIERRIFNQNQRFADACYKSGYFSDVKSMAQAVVKIELGRAWNMSAADSMKHIFFINGRPGVMEEYTAMKMQEAGYSWEIQWIGGMGPRCKGCRLFISKDGEPMMKPARDLDGSFIIVDGKMITEQVSVSFTLEDAQMIRVWEKGKQILLTQKSGPWSDGWAGNMMYFRCISQLRRFHCPNVLSGARTAEEAVDLPPLEPEPVATGIGGALLEAINSGLAATAPPKKKGVEQPNGAASVDKPTDPPAPADSAKPPEGKTPKPVQAETLKQIRRMEAELTSAVFKEVLVQSTFSSIEEIKYEIDATAVLMRLVQLQKDRAKEKGK